MSAENTQRMPRRGPIVLGTIGTDPHVVGIKILEYALSKAGFKVVCLGSMVDPKEFIEAAIETKASSILVSSMSGHAEVYASDFRSKCDEAGLRNILLYIGGYLVVGRPDWPRVEAKFKEMGFDRTYPPRTLPQQVVLDLKHDLGLSGETEAAE